VIGYNPGPYPPCACTVRYVGAVCIDCDGTVDDHAAFQAGAAVAFGLMGMAEAIRSRRPPLACLSCDRRLSVVEDEVWWFGDRTFCTDCAAAGRPSDMSPPSRGTDP
jgi:hypothetical protein